MKWREGGGNEIWERGVSEGDFYGDDAQRLFLFFLPSSLLFFLPTSRKKERGRCPKSRTVGVRTVQNFFSALLPLFEKNSFGKGRWVYRLLPLSSFFPVCSRYFLLLLLLRQTEQNSRQASKQAATVSSFPIAPFLYDFLQPLSVRFRTVTTCVQKSLSHCKQLDPSYIPRQSVTTGCRILPSLPISQITDLEMQIKINSHRVWRLQKRIYGGPLKRSF